jgi:hypothetical protein
MTAAITWILENMSLATLLVALVLGSIASKRKAPNAGGGWEPTVFWLMLLFVGLSGLYTGLLHLFVPVQTAAEIGWKTSPFQWEVGVADFMLGVLGVMAAWGNRSFRWAVVVALCIWFWGDAVGHVRQMRLADNFASGNAGSWFWVDVLGPGVLLAAHGLNRSGRK